MTPFLLACLVAAATPAEPPRDKLRFGLDYRWWGRNVQFQGDPSMADMSVGPLPIGATFDIQWFPAAYFVDDARADLGLAVRADVSSYFRLNSGGSNYTATAARMRTALMFRIPFHHVEPSVQAGFQAFDATTSLVAGDGTPRPRFPNVSLAGPRLGLGLRLLEFWRITFDVGVGATVIVATGEIGNSNWFPGAKGNAIDGNLGLAFRTWSFLDVRIGVDVTVHSLTLGKGVTATDAYYGFSIGLVFKGVPLPGE